MYSASAYEEAVFEPSPGIRATSSDNSSLLLSSTETDMSRYSPGYTVGEASRVTYMPEQSSYTSLFRSDSEIPPFFVPYRWWEDEATTVLWAFDVQEIKRVIRYGLFRDPNLPRTSLQSRNSTTIDTFLLSLLEPHERFLLSNLSHVQKVEEILRRSTISSPPSVPWSWFPSQKDRDLDPRALARDIDAESHLHFKRISFEELVRYSLGYPAASVNWFLQQHTALYIHLLNYLNAFPEEVARYTEVENHLRGRSPFAHRALVHCLLSMQSQTGLDVPLVSSQTLAFEFIAGPIQNLFQDSPPSLTSILKVLSVLRVRFQRAYVHAREMNWVRPFNTSVCFLDDLLASTSAVDFARTLTNIDEGQFSTLTPPSIAEESSVALRLIEEWGLLSTAVWECCAALPDLVPYLQECAEALLTSRNYHSFTAVLNGLQKYSITALTITDTNNGTSTVALNPVLPPNLVYLLNPFRNYAAYRRQFQEFPGIPFLSPHLREIRQHGEPALRQFFNSLQIRTR
ncbi:hypothetical protein IFM61606_09835 [Aspergillus udagawae]|uniref:Ras-GEF domain-containing protein n=1 Tax=Aspergillus udagawae TaxID=91492 RepID=A0ABQ1B9L6_9EURO|nr:hypothetical protein IFM61606_09835 [Aspergillus udagawae]GFF37344.1 hypothetical protein IFM51744_03432 [Aspergillus udagawae]GFF96849.1 hypothetical protein IFM53868_08756 [Aspergillus udagawae]GFG06996.1 hypothetical protein IFM5058_03199 [Aspergillus udagawae]